MEWRDEGIILGVRRHGETSAILEVMTKDHGRHLGVVRGGRSRRQQPILQSGNRVEVVWRARLDEHIGHFNAEPIDLNAARFFDSATAIFGLQTLASHLRLLPERDAHPRLYETLILVLANLDHPPNAAELVVRFELMLLDELGFGLDLARCAATGVSEDLAFVSPRTGRAVSRVAAEPWKDRMLVLPDFVRPGSRARAVSAGVGDAFRLTGHFLARHVWEARGIEAPEARAAFVQAITREFERLAREGETAA